MSLPKTGCSAVFTSYNTHIGHRALKCANQQPTLPQQTGWFRHKQEASTHGPKPSFQAIMMLNLSRYYDHDSVTARPQVLWCTPWQQLQQHCKLLFQQCGLIVHAMTVPHGTTRTPRQESQVVGTCLVQHTQAALDS